MLILIQRVRRAKSGNFAAYLFRFVFEIGRGHGYEPSDFYHIILSEAASGNRRCSDTDAAGYKGALGVVGYGIFIDGNVDFVQPFFKLFAGSFKIACINKH